MAPNNLLSKKTASKAYRQSCETDKKESDFLKPYLPLAIRSHFHQRFLHAFFCTKALFSSYVLATKSTFVQRMRAKNVSKINSRSLEKTS